MATQTFTTAAQDARDLVEARGLQNAQHFVQQKLEDTRFVVGGGSFDRYAYWLAVEGEINYQFTKPQTE